MRGRTMHTTFAHMPGACGLAGSSDGRFLLTSGIDSTVRAHDIRDTPDAWWRQDSPQEAELPDMAGTSLHDKAIGSLALAPGDVTLATGSDDGFVRIFSLQVGKGSAAMTVDAELVQACARFGGPVRAMDFSPTGMFLAAAGDEPGVLKIVMTAQPSNVNVLRAPTGGKGNEAIGALAFDTKGDFVCTVGEKGEAVVWDVENCTLAASVSLNNRKAKCVAWAPDGSKLVFGTDKGVVIVARDQWLFDYLLEDASDQDDDDEEMFASASGKDAISAVAWSPNGRYLLSACEDAKIVLWDVEQRKVLGSWKGQEAAQKLRWHPNSNAFTMIDKIGQWGIVADVVPSHLPSPQSETRAVDLPTLPVTENKNRRSADGAEDDEEFEVKRSKGAKARRQKQQERLKSRKDKSAASTKKNDELSVADDDEELQNGFTFNPSDVEADDEEELRDKNAPDSDESDGDSGTDEDLGGEYDDLENAGVPPLPRRHSKRRQDHIQRRSRPIQNTQPPFMPTSTPLSEKRTKKKHILAWNLVGAILSFDESTHDVIEVEFADASKRTVGIKDHFGYTMGCLSETGVLLATPKTKDHGALITFRPFSSWSTNSDWTQFLPSDEDTSVIALGQRFAAIATTPNNIVRLFSLSGIQTTTFGIPGDIISAAASGNRLVIVYSEPDSSLLKCELVEISCIGEVEKVTYTGNIVISPRNRLEWIGFTNDTLELCAYDAQGWLWVLMDPKAGKRWVPLVQNAAKLGECDWFWVASATSETLIGAPCLSNERFPPAKPRPALRSLPFSAPVIEQVNKNGKPTVSERFARTQLKLNRAMAAKIEADDLYNSDDEEVAEAEDDVARMEVETDKCILALMEDACRNEHNMRALDLATRLHAKISFKYAIELANHFKRTALASRVEQVARHKLSVIDEEERQRVALQQGLRTSPTTPPSMRQRPVQRGEKDCENDASCSPDAGAGTRRIEPMDWGSDDEEPKKATSKPQKPKVKPQKTASDIGFDDVTDDEDEVRTERPKAPPAQATKGIEKKSEDAQRAPKKRSSPVFESQASATGVENATVAKKAKVAKTATSVGTQRSFRNRFMKK